MKKMVLLLASAAAALLALPSAYAVELSCHNIFQDNMCLQRRAPIKISGKADPGKTVTVSLETIPVVVPGEPVPDPEPVGKPASAKVNDKGEWEVKIEPLEAGGPYRLKYTDGTTSKDFKNVLIGEVWICAGQSNMELPVSTGNTMIQIKNHQQEAAAANYPRIRLIEVPKTKAPGDEFDEIAGVNPDRNLGVWMECSPRTVPNFSAAGYFFARQLQKDLDIPVGLIMTAWGGVNIETFIPDSEFAKHNRNEAKQIENALVAGAANPATGQAGGQFNSEKFPGTMWGAMVYPWTRYTVGGVLFYQGESNTGNKDYYALHKMLIDGWREKFNDPKQPWVICQLAGFEQWTPMNRLPEDQWKSKAPPNNVDGWPLTREIQDEMSYIYENVNSVPLMDIGDQSDIHPRDKQSLGYRLAKLVEWKYFGGELGVGPVYDHMDIQGSKCIIHFKNVGKGLSTSDGEAPGAFAIAGADGKFVWADAKIVGDTVEVSSAQVPEPKTVRFAYAMYRGDANLINKDGFPAYPFRTDKVKNEYEKKK